MSFRKAICQTRFKFKKLSKKHSQNMYCYKTIHYILDKNAFFCCRIENQGLYGIMAVILYVAVKSLKHLNKENSAKLSMVFSTALFGTIGLFIKYIGMPSGFIALVRGILGAVFLFAVMAIKKEKPGKELLKKNFRLLLLSGACIGTNWVLLFESYNYTTVAKATLCYYLAPVIVIILSPFVLKEKLTVKKVICVIISLIGMTAVSGVVGSDFNNCEIPGLLLGFGAAVLYAFVIILNKKLSSLPSFTKTAFQLIFAAVTVLPYAILATDFGSFEFSAIPVILLLVVGILHTGFAYTIYFGSIGCLSTQSAAIMSYIDPVVAVLLSVFILKENFTVLTAAGAAAILVSTLISELPEKRKTS